MINSPESSGEALQLVPSNSHSNTPENTQNFRNFFTKIRQISGRVGLAIALSTSAGAASEITYSVLSTDNAAEAATACGEILVAGKDWMGGQGIDVRSNGFMQTTGSSCKGETETYDLGANPSQYGFGWQCVELAN